MARIVNIMKKGYLLKFRIQKETVFQREVFFILGIVIADVMQKIHNKLK